MYIECELKLVATDHTITLDGRFASGRLASVEFGFSNLRAKCGGSPANSRGSPRYIHLASKVPREGPSCA